MSERITNVSGIPKPLLPIAGIPLLSRWLTVLDSSKSFDKIYVVVSFLRFTSESANKLKIVCLYACIVIYTLYKILICFVKTNGANHEIFVAWSKNWPDVELVSDGCMTNEVSINNRKALTLTQNFYSAMY